MGLCRPNRLLSQCGSYRDRGSLGFSARRIAWEILFEVLLVVLFLKLYNHIRNQFGSQRCSPYLARMHALQVIRVEQLLGLFWEHQVQSRVLQYPLFISFWNVFYGTAHMAVTVFVLSYLFILKPSAYQRSRTVFMVMNMIALAGYACYPLMPPRLLNDCIDPYGGCLKDPELNFVDTMEEYGGLWSWRSKGLTKVSNHYAAMPSMHAGYSTWCSTSILKHSQSSLLRALAILYPVLTLYCITVTANHYPLDAVFGVLALLAAAKVAPFMPQLGRGAASHGGFALDNKSEESIDLSASSSCSMRRTDIELGNPEEERITRAELFSDYVGWAYSSIKKR